MSLLVADHTLTNCSSHHPKEEDVEPELAKQETRALLWLKVVAFLLLFGVGCGMAWLTFTLARDSENGRFESAFDDQASRLIETFYKNMINQYWIASTLGLAISSHGAQGTFPFVTVPTFESIGFGQLQLIRGKSFSWAPLIHNEEEKRRWEGYAYANASAAGYGDDEHQTYYNNRTYEINDKEWKGRAIEHGIFEFYNDNWPAKRQGPGPYSPIWQTAPIAKTRRAVMLDQFSDPIRAMALSQMLEFQLPVLSGLLNDEFEHKITHEFKGPRSILYSPIHFDDEVVGSIQIETEWSSVFEGATEESLAILLDNSCGETATYMTYGPRAEFVGFGDQHNCHRDDLMLSSTFEGLHRSWLSFFADVDAPQQHRDFFMDNGRDSQGRETCKYSLRIYPTEDFQEQFFTSRPAITTVAVCMMFAFCALIFLAYNYLVERRQRKVLDTAVRSKAVINSLFPQKFGDRLFFPKKNKEKREKRELFEESRLFGASNKLKLNALLSEPITLPSVNRFQDEEPIAEMFATSTIIFADIAGFTAWSSQREPHQVFQLLETIYSEFDSIATSLGVFKVETIGDCYVAVTGVPTVQEDHATLMARFAIEILERMSILTNELEISLGPGTSELRLRIGCHSGAVTAGVLRGEKSRFQLFGDTMNTASRMESTGVPGKVHISQEMADLIVASRKGHWLVKRKEAVQAKGLGTLETYWLNPEKLKSESTLSTIVDLEQVNAYNSSFCLDLSQQGDESDFESRLERMIDWNVDVLLKFLEKLVESRTNSGSRVFETKSRTRIDLAGVLSAPIVSEVTEVIQLPPYAPHTTRRGIGNRANSQRDLINESVRTQLRGYVSEIAAMYHDVPFHNFEHASHVALSANKLMKRIISPKDVEYDQASTSNVGTYEEDLHNSTFGISSDPLTQFSIVFAALIHDVAHHGVPNSQLIKEDHQIALKYGNKSVAEQHSVNLALSLLRESDYVDLQMCICSTEAEKVRFRQLLVNCVLATDLVDEELSNLRKNRWAKAFLEPRRTQRPESNEDCNRKATIVLEHIIQASDIAHTMQHWHIYKKWNEKLYREMYIAYLDGRATSDPSEGWYENEISFFDNYVIPLARNLKDCGVFGVSSDEYLAYALTNRDEWKVKGEALAVQMASRRKEIEEFRQSALDLKGRDYL